jgi:hypothetical protein
MRAIGGNENPYPSTHASQPTLFPATPPAGGLVAPSTDVCGSLTADEQAAMTTAAQQAFASLPSP